MTSFAHVQLNLYIIGILFQFWHRLAARNFVVWWIMTAFLTIASIAAQVYEPLPHLLGIQLVSNFVMAAMILFDERHHIAVNCYTERDSKTGIMVHSYGPYIFHTSREDVWNFVNRVKAATKKGIFSLPINLLTINQFFSKTVRPKEAKEFVTSVADRSIITPQNFKKQALLSMLGLELYEAFSRGYTKKQWGVDPVDLPASIVVRLPMRFTYVDDY